MIQHIESGCRIDSATLKQVRKVAARVVETFLWCEEIDGVEMVQNELAHPGAQHEMDQDIGVYNDGATGISDCELRAAA